MELAAKPQEKNMKKITDKYFSIQIDGPFREEDKLYFMIDVSAKKDRTYPRQQKISFSFFIKRNGNYVSEPIWVTDVIEEGRGVKNMLRPGCDFEIILPAKSKCSYIVELSGIVKEKEEIHLEIKDVLGRGKNPIFVLLKGILLNEDIKLSCI